MDFSDFSSYNIDFNKCKQCGKKVPVNSVFCIHCGQVLKEEVVKKKKQSKRIKLPEVLLQMEEDNFEEPELVFEEPEPEIKKVILHKRQKFIPIEPLTGRMLDYFLMMQETGSVGLQSLAHIDVEPRPYQIEAARSIIESQGGSGILADEVGLGKTIEAGIIIKEMILRKAARKILILVPSSLLYQWEVELREKFNLEIMGDNDIDKIEDEFFSGIMLLSLHKAKSKKVQGIFLKKSWDMLLVDEAHSLKNHLTQAHKFVFGLKRKYTILLTATPIQNDLRELYNLINIVRPGYFKSIRFFRRKYMSDRFTPRNPRELRRMCSRVMVRHRRADTLIKLPPREVKTIFVQPSKIEEEFYNLTLELARKAVAIANRESADHIMLLLSILLKESTSSPQALLATLEAAILPKVLREKEGELLKRVLKLGKNLGKTAKMEGLLKVINEEDSPIIVYSEYLRTQEILTKIIEEDGHQVYRYAGNLRLEEKERSLRNFREKGGVLLSTEVGGQGLNLQHCQRMVNFDLPWNPMRIEQRIGRIHRFGQQKKVKITTIAGKNTFEEYLVKILISKIKLFKMVIGEIDSILAYLKNPLPLEKRISQIILESNDSNLIQKRLDNLADEILEARQQFNQDRDSSAKLLDLPAEK
ncbi:MAG: SNF2-related protein [Myxococcota bacterium]